MSSSGMLPKPSGVKIRISIELVETSNGCCVGGASWKQVNACDFVYVVVCYFLYPIYFYHCSLALLLDYEVAGFRDLGAMFVAT